MEINAFKYYQGNQNFYSTVMTFEEIINNSTVSIYSRNNRLGYQRSLVERHLKKIVVSLKTGSTPISPTSILLGIDEENLIDEDDLTRKSSKDATYIKFKENKDNNTFRIIDGQHRIMAMNRYIQELNMEDHAEKISELNSYEFSVIIMPINLNRRIKEVEVFQSINAKAKPLKTDLVKLALTRYEELERVEKLDYTNHLAKRIIFSLNDDKPYEEESVVNPDEESAVNSNTEINVWKNGIIIDINNDDEMGIISYNAFYKSIEPLCKIYTAGIHDDLIKNISYDDLDKYLNILSNKITCELIIPCWKIIMDRWKDCFSYKKISFDDEIYYDENYYIQKNMGLRSLHNILTTIVRSKGDNKEDFTQILSEFKEIIISSKLVSEDWEKGGRFKGLSSEAGFKHIESIIRQ